MEGTNSSFQLFAVFNTKCFFPSRKLNSYNLILNKSLVLFKSQIGFILGLISFENNQIGEYKDDIFLVLFKSQIGFILGLISFENNQIGEYKDDIFLLNVSGFFLRRVSEDYQAHCRVQLAKDFPDVSAEVLQKFLLRNKNLYLRSFRALQDHCKLEGHELGIPG